MKEVSQSLEEWFDTPQGRYLLAREQAFFDRTVADIFGYNALQLGLPQRDFLGQSRIPLRATVGHEEGVTVWLELDELPFDTSSIDLVILPHALEFNLYPHRILREVERVLRPEGQVLISGFNPRSLWGLRRFLGKRAGYPWCGQFISLPRMKDWLTLLGFEMRTGGFACYAPPLTSPQWLQRFRFMEPSGDRWWAICGGVYFIQAVKRVPGVRLIRPKWNDGLMRLLPAAPKLRRDVTQKHE